MLAIVMNTLAARRFEKNRISQYDTARAVGMSINRYWRVENDYVEPTEEERTALAAFFGVDESIVFQVPTEDGAPSTSSLTST